MQDSRHRFQIKPASMLCSTVLETIRVKSKQPPCPRSHDAENPMLPNQPWVSQLQRKDKRRLTLRQPLQAPRLLRLRSSKIIQPIKPLLSVTRCSRRCRELLRSPWSDSPRAPQLASTDWASYLPPIPSPRRPLLYDVTGLLPPCHSPHSSARLHPHLSFS